MAELGHQGINLDFKRIREGMASPCIVDGRNVLDPKQLKGLGFQFMAKAPAAEVQSHLYVALDQGYLSQKEFQALYDPTDRDPDSGLELREDFKRKLKERLKRPSKRVPHEFVKRERPLDS